LGQKDLKNVDQIKHWTPRLVDHIQADTAGHVIHIRVKQTVAAIGKRTLMKGKRGIEKGS